jgi:hypothetical protein
VTQSELPCVDRISDELATAVDAAGRVAIVALSPNREVVAMTIDLEAPQASRCRTISTHGESAADANQGSPSIIGSVHGFVAAWIRSDGTIRACKFSDLASAPFVIDVGEGADIANPLAHLVQANEDESLTFIWKNDRSIVVRRLPEALGGFAFLTELDRFRCSFTQALPGSR